VGEDALAPREALLADAQQAEREPRLEVELARIGDGQRGAVGRRASLDDLVDDRVLGARWRPPPVDEIEHADELVVLADHQPRIPPDAAGGEATLVVAIAVAIERERGDPSDLIADLDPRMELHPALADHRLLVDRIAVDRSEEHTS